MEKFIKKFEVFVDIYKDIENTVFDIIDNNFPLMAIKRADNINKENYIANNYLSMIFLGIYKGIGLSYDKIIFYGVINYIARGIVTCADNLFDQEHKFNFDYKKLSNTSPRAKSTFSIILLQNVLDIFLEQKVNSMDIKKELFNELFAIGLVEAEEEEDKDKILSPKDIIEKVNFYRGSRLLGIAFIALLIVEKKNKKIEKIKTAVLKMGMGLQLLDDISDIGIDVKCKKRNYLASVLAYSYSLNYEQLKIETALQNFKEKYKKEIELSYEEGLDYIRKSIKSLAPFGFFMSASELDKLVNFIIKSRQFEEFFPKQNKEL